MADYIPSIEKNFTPRKNPPQVAVNARTRELSPVDITDKDALRSLGLKTLVSVIQANPTALAVVPALKELFDRVDGKAPQSIIQSGSVTNEVNMNFTIEFVKPKVIEHDNTIP